MVLSARVSDRIRRLREARGWSQLELSRRAGLSQVGVHLIEAQGRDPKLSTACKIAAAFGLTVDELLGETDAA